MSAWEVFCGQWFGIGKLVVLLEIKFHLKGQIEDQKRQLEAQLRQLEAQQRLIAHYQADVVRSDVYFERQSARIDAIGEEFKTMHVVYEARRSADVKYIAALENMLDNFMPSWRSMLERPKDASA
jgi:hypothetical protein